MAFIQIVSMAIVFPPRKQVGLPSEHLLNGPAGIA